MSKLTFLVLFSSLFTFKVDANEQKIIIDNDAGADDAMAIFLALLYEKHFGGPELIGLTTANGNTNEDNVTINNQKILRTAKRQDVPIYRGSKSALVFTPTTNNYFGDDGLGNNDEPLTGLSSAQKEHAVYSLIKLSKEHEGKLTVITIGALTNIALAIKLDPEFLGRLKHLYVGAGHIASNNHTTVEFNAHMDVEAYHIVAQIATPDKVTLLPFSRVSDELDLSKDWRLNVFGALDTDIVRAQNIYERVSIPKQEGWAELDPAVVALALCNIPTNVDKRPDFVTEYKYFMNDIILCGEKRGFNTNTLVSKEEANVRVAYSFDKEKYRSFLMDVFSADVK